MSPADVVQRLARAVVPAVLVFGSLVLSVVLVGLVANWIGEA